MSTASCSTPRQPYINTVLFTLWRVFTLKKVSVLTVLNLNQLNNAVHHRTQAVASGWADVFNQVDFLEVGFHVKGHNVGRGFVINRRHQNGQQAFYDVGIAVYVELKATVHHARVYPNEALAALYHAVLRVQFIGHGGQFFA